MAHGGVLGGFKRFWRLTSLQNSLFCWWAARVSIPAPWDPLKTIRARPWSSKSPGPRHRPVRPRPRKSSRIWALGYKIGYTNSVLASSGLCDSRTRMANHSNFGSKVDRTDRRYLDKPKNEHHQIESVSVSTPTFGLVETAYGCEL